MRRLPKRLAFTCWVNWNGPGLTNVPNRRLLYERAISCAEVEAHRVHVLCEYTRTRWRGPSELPLTFSVYWWLMRTVVGVTVTSRLDADADAVKTSRPVVASNPTSRRLRCERPEGERNDIECMGTLSAAPPRPPEFGATLSRRRAASQGPAAAPRARPSYYSGWRMTGRLAAAASSSRRTGVVYGAFWAIAGSSLASRRISAMTSAKASSVSFVSVSVGSTRRASSTSSGKYTVGGCMSWSSRRLARSRVLTLSSRFIGAPESTNSCMQRRS